MDRDMPDSLLAYMGLASSIGDFFVADQRAKAEAIRARHNGRMQAAGFEYQAALADQNALLVADEILGIQAESTRAQLDIEGKLTGLKGAQRVAMAASGFEIEDRGAENRRAVAVAQADIRGQEQRAHRAKLLEQHGYRQKAAGLRWSAKAALAGADVSAQMAKLDGLSQQAAALSTAATSLFFSQQPDVPEPQANTGSGYMAGGRRTRARSPRRSGGGYMATRY